MTKHNNSFDMTGHKQWLENEIQKACNTAKEEGLPGDIYRVELFSTGGRIFSTEIEHVKTGWKCEDGNYPEFNQPTILRLSGLDNQAFEVALATIPAGMLVKETTRAATV